MTSIIKLAIPIILFVGAFIAMFRRCTPKKDSGSSGSDEYALGCGLGMFLFAVIFVSGMCIVWLTVDMIGVFK